jgi:hypothetical protein
MHTYTDNHVPYVTYSPAIAAQRQELTKWVVVVKGKTTVQLGISNRNILRLH